MQFYLNFFCKHREIPHLISFNLLIVLLQSCSFLCKIIDKGTLFQIFQINFFLLLRQFTNFEIREFLLRIRQVFGFFNDGLSQFLTYIFKLSIVGLLLLHVQLQQQSDMDWVWSYIKDGLKLIPGVGMIVDFFDSTIWKSSLFNHLWSLIMSNKGMLFKQFILDYFVLQLHLLGFPSWIVNQIKFYLESLVLRMQGRMPQKYLLPNGSLLPPAQAAPQPSAKQVEYNKWLQTHGKGQQKGFFSSAKDMVGLGYSPEQIQEFQTMKKAKEYGSHKERKKKQEQDAYNKLGFGDKIYNTVWGETKKMDESGIDDVWLENYSKGNINPGEMNQKQKQLLKQALAKT